MPARAFLLGTADPESPLHQLRNCRMILKLILRYLIIQPQLFVFKESSSINEMPARLSEDSETRLVFFGDSCLLVSKWYRSTTARTAGALDSCALQWDILRGTARRTQAGSLTLSFAWDVHIQRVIRREQWWSGGSRYNTRESYTDTCWEEMDIVRSSVKWQSIQLDKHPWREVRLDENVHSKSAKCLLFDSITLEDNPSERDDEEYEHWYPHWKLLGLRMHGLYKLDEFSRMYEYHTDAHRRTLPLSIDNLNSLFGFSDKQTGRALHSKALWEPHAEDDLTDPETDQEGFIFLPLRDRYADLSDGS